MYRSNNFESLSVSACCIICWLCLSETEYTIHDMANIYVYFCYSAKWKLNGKPKPTWKLLNKINVDLKWENK